MPSIAVITPAPSPIISALVPSEMTGQPSDWEWYHHCLSRIGEVRYTPLDEADTIRGVDVVLVHEALETMRGSTVQALAGLRRRNGKVVWVEPHQRSTFSATVFEPGFFDAVDLVAKHQLMEWGALVDGLSSSTNNLAPWALFGHPSIDSFYASRKLFGMPTSRATFQRHLEGDLSEHYGDRIVPLMRLFTMARASSWYYAPPSRQTRILRESDIAVPLQDLPSTWSAGLITGMLGRLGLTVKAHGSRVRAAATSDAYIGLGPIHLDSGAADVLRFDTLAVLPHDERYLIWDDVFVAGESYLPIEGFGRLIRNGGRVVDGEASREITERLQAQLSDAALRERILAGQRRAHAQLTDPRFVAGRLGIDAPPLPPPPPRAPVELVSPAPGPVTVAGISSRDISVVIQGALSGDNLPERVVASIRATLPGAEIILSTWEGQRALDLEVDQRIESEDPGTAWQVHEEWPANTNRLLVSTLAGLRAATRPYCLKLRSDSPLSGTGFLEGFTTHPERSPYLQLLRDRIVVVNLYCWNPAIQPFGLYAVADTVNFGWTEDLRELWDRPLADETENVTWFETHTRPDPDPAWWAAFRYTPEQVLWLGLLSKHLNVPFAHFADTSSPNWVLSELSVANNSIILEPERFGVEFPRFAGRPPLEPGAVFTYEAWHELYLRYCHPDRRAVAERTLGDAGAWELLRGNELRGDGAPPGDGAGPDPLAGARRFVVVCDGPHLLADDGLLRAWAEEMAGLSTVTLVIDASHLPAADAEQQLVSAVSRCGLAEREDIDLLAVTGPQDEAARRSLWNGAHAVYGDRPPGGPADLPVFSASQLAALRELAERAG